MMSRVFRALGALLVLLAALVGPPVALLQLGRVDGLAHIDWSRALMMPDDGSLFLGLLTVVAWLAWLVLATTVVFEVIAVATANRLHLRLPGTRWLAMIVAGLVVSVGTVFIAGPSLIGARPTAVVRLASPVLPSPAPAVVVAQTATPEPVKQGAADGARQHVVAVGDDLWSLASHYFGDGAQWRRIADSNPEIDPAAQLAPGTVLAIPDSDPSQQAQGPGAPGGSGSATPGTASVAAGPQATGTPPSAPSSASPSSSAAVVPPVDVQPTAPVDGPSDVSSGQLLGAAAAIGGVLAGGLLTVLSRHRLRQLWQRALGRRIKPVDDAVRRFEQALAQRASIPSDDDALPPTSVVLGWYNDRSPAVVDIEANGLTRVSGDVDSRTGAFAVITSSLVCAEWSAGRVQQYIVGRHESWAVGVDEPLVGSIDEIAAGLSRLNQLLTARRSAMMSSTLDELRADPDIAELWQPTVFLFCEPLSGEQRERLVALGPGEVGLSVVLASDDDAADIRYAEGMGWLSGREFRPQLMPAPARSALIELFEAAASDETVPAPWWCDDDDLPPNVTLLRRMSGLEEFSMDPLPPDVPTHPTLLLLGPVELVGAAGEPPRHARKQCEEYCAWLLSNPGKTATAMSEAMVVAEPTRRSNMSRLRTWLGSDPQGQPYLPDAYSGRIQLHADVSSDWERFIMLTAGGVNRSTIAALRQAMSLVRGAPLANSAPWQWQWAEGLRTDMVSAIRDAGVVLAELALEIDEFDLARWALGRGFAAAPDDELLLATLAKVEHYCGNGDDVKRIAMQLTRQARLAGVDLQDHTVTILQEALEGRRRAREV